MMHVMRGMAIIVLAAGAIISPSRSAPAALANPACNANGNSSWAGFYWQPGGTDHLYGVRAPVKLRTDGLLRADSSNDATSSAWLMIQTVSGSQFVQIGFIHRFNSNGVGQWCRFWETSNNLPQAYDCASDADDTEVYFKIEEFCTAYGCTYAIYDCGTGGDFTQCSPMDASMPLFSSPAVAVSSEAHFWCIVRMMGQGSDRVWYGNNTWATSIEDSNGWSKNRNWTDYGGNNCPSDY